MERIEVTSRTGLPISIIDCDACQVYYNEAMGLSPESKARGEKLVSGGMLLISHSSSDQCGFQDLNV